MQHFKKWWAFYGHSAVLALVYFLSPSVQAFTAAHPSATLLAVGWTYILHFLQSPVAGKTASASGQAGYSRIGAMGLSAACVIAALLFVGCTASSVLSAIVAWEPFAVQTFEGFVSLVAPANTQLPAEAENIGKLVQDVGASAQAAESAGAGKAGMQQVIAEISAVTPSIQNFESQLTAAGLPISANAQKYVSGASALVLASLDGYEAELESQAGTPAATAQIEPVEGDCYGFEPAAGHTPFHVWANCAGPDDAIDYYGGSSAQAVKTIVNPAANAPSLDKWKRQVNGLARRYGYNARQLHITRWESIKHYVSLGWK